MRHQFLITAATVLLAVLSTAAMSVRADTLATATPADVGRLVAVTLWYDKVVGDAASATLASNVVFYVRRQDPEAEPPVRWTTHDLRRTARSFMSRAGVPPDHAERALGHVISGVRGVYDRHAYYHEKKHAFEALAAQIERILNKKSNVMVLRAEA